MNDTLPPPTHFPQDGPCPYCKSLAQRDKDNRRLCDRCHTPIPVYPGMGGSGYESASVHHFHAEAMGTAVGRIPRMCELCRECYVADYLKVFGKDPGLAPLDNGS